MVKSILICFAHPDDEVSCGPLITKYMTEGAQATFICTTNGDVGTVAPEYMKNYSSIAELRLAELACATKALGFTEVVTFGYRDSGMMGSADNLEVGSSWQAPLEEVTTRVAEVMRRVRPQVVITFNAYGFYGHPDHIKIHQATVAAFQLLQSESEHPQKLYYTTFPRSLMRIALLIMKAFGQDPRRIGTNKDTDVLKAFESLTPVTTKIAVARYLAASRAASDCYASQIHIPSFVRLLRPILAPLALGTLHLSRIYPEPQPGEPIERNLFEHVIFAPPIPSHSS